VLLDLHTYVLSLLEISGSSATPWACQTLWCPVMRVKRQSNPITGLEKPWSFQDVEAPRFPDNRHIKLVRLSALRSGRLYPPGNIPGNHFCERLNQPQGHIAAGRVMSMKNSNDTFGSRTRHLPACSAVPQPSGYYKTNYLVSVYVESISIKCNSEIE
jgi:hypothetical protein